jgi:NADH-quinone oxidoreductase subunit G
LVKTAIDILQNGAGHSPSLKEIERADSILILGEDITNTAPMVALAVRQAARNKGIEMAGGFGIPKWNDSAQREKAQDLKSTVFITSPFYTKLDDVAERTFRASNADIARLGFAVASLIDKDTPSGKDLDKEQLELAQQIADTLKEAKSPLIICGVHGGDHELIHSAANITRALSLNGNKPSLSFLVPECNSMGLGMMEGQPFEDAAGRIANGDIDTLVILENDIYRRADKAVVDYLFERCKNIVVLDHLVSETTQKADILLPVGTFAESEGTLVNNEGRAQRFYRVLPPNTDIPESWQQISDLSGIRKEKNTPTWENFDDLVREMTDTLPVFSKIKGHLPNADFRVLNEKIKRQTIRFSGRTAMNANIAVSEPKPPQDPDSPLAFSMEGSEEIPPSSLVS